MVLRDHEQRQLDEIERLLAEQSPRLARRFSAFRPVPTSALVAGVVGMLILLTTGLVIMVVGVQLSAPALIVIGALITTVVPATIGWHFNGRIRA
jgi:uncharacterized membrane protein YdcZ (DUF606 family)